MWSDKKDVKFEEIIIDSDKKDDGKGRLAAYASAVSELKKRGHEKDVKSL